MKRLPEKPFTEQAEVNGLSHSVRVLIDRYLNVGNVMNSFNWKLMMDEASGWHHRKL